MRLSSVWRRVCTAQRGTPAHCKGFLRTHAVQVGRANPGEGSLIDKDQQTYGIVSCCFVDLVASSLRFSRPISFTYSPLRASGMPGIFSDLCSVVSVRNVCKRARNYCTQRLFLNITH